MDTVAFALWRLTSQNLAMDPNHPGCDVSRRDGEWTLLRGIVSLSKIAYIQFSFELLAED